MVVKDQSKEGGGGGTENGSGGSNTEGSGGGEEAQGRGGGRGSCKETGKFFQRLEEVAG